MSRGFGKVAKLARRQAVLDDGDLMERARAKAGGNLQLAERLGLDQSSTSRWGRVRPIPRKYRSTIEDYVAGSPAAVPSSELLYVGLLRGLRAQLLHAIESIDRAISEPKTSRNVPERPGQGPCHPSEVVALPAEVTEHSYRRRLNQIADRATDLIPRDEERRTFRLRVDQLARDATIRPDLDGFERNPRTLITFVTQRYPLVQIRRTVSDFPDPEVVKP
jgi:hypothetical protein